jgi:GDP-4-dehydro-6-deoxy-D-mannose reductase
VRYLITGAGGFAGRHLLRHLNQIQPDADLHGTIYGKKHNLPDAATYHALNLLDGEAVEMLLDRLQPDVIVHLAAQSSPSKSYDTAWQTLESNVKMQLHLIQGCLSCEIQPRMVAITSGEIYRTDASLMPLTEEAGFMPGNPYGLSKITQDMLCWQYYLTHNLPIIRARPFNHTGPGQRESFVAPDFAMQIARIEAGMQEPVMFVGNLRPARDFTDVRDVVRAYVLLAEHGQPGTAYNIASNTAHSAQWLLDTLLSHTDTQIEVRVDEAKLRPVDVPLKQGDYSRLHEATGWQPAIPFEDTLLDLLNDCRQRVQQTSP